jgi:hypothetical protein
MDRTRFVAALLAALVLPAVLFMLSLFLRSAFPPAEFAERLIVWYSGRVWTLWVLLLALPAVAFVAGWVTLARSGAWRLLREHVATLLVAATTMASAAILGIVVLHIAAN